MTHLEIIEKYQSGESISAISRTYGIPYKQIQNILRDNNITIRGGRKKKTLSPDKLAELKEDYFNGVIYKELSEKYKLDKDTLQRIIKENNFTRRNNNRINKRIKSDYFSKIDSPEKAYWIGFLFTDGSVNYGKTDSRQPRIRFQLQASDKEILEQYKEDLGLDCALIHDSRENKECYSVEFVDTQIFDDLAKFGIIPNKTYATTHLQYEQIPQQFLPAYVLGLIDGDGSLSCSENFSTDVTLSFTTYHESVAKDFQLLVDDLIGKTEHTKIFFTHAWHAQWRGRIQVLKILDILYNNCPRHLERKYNKYIQLKNSLN